MFRKERNIKNFNGKGNLFSRESLVYNATLSHPIENEVKNNNDPINKILNFLKFENIKKIIQLPDKDIYLFLYFNRHIIHLVLYENEEFIFINENKIKELKDIFYISLLIKENDFIINYIYSINFLKKLNEIQKIEKKGIKKIFISKIIINLIENYEKMDDLDNNNYINELDKYNNDNLKTIHDNIDLLKQFNLNEKDILTKNIDELYSIIINNLIINQKLDESEFTKDIIEQLDLKSINITKIIFDGLVKILNKEKDYIKKYSILEYEDLFNNKKLTFYYILIKDILKSDFYIYKIPLLIEIKNNILKIRNNNKYEFLFNGSQKKEVKIKIEYLFKAFSIYNDYLMHKSLKVKKYNEQYISNLNSSTENISTNNINHKNDKNVLDFNNNNNYSISTFSNSFGFYKGKSYKREKENSLRSFESFEDTIKSEREEKLIEFKNDICFQIMTNSTFTFKIIKISGKNTIKYNHITYNSKEKIDIDTLKKKSSNNEIIDYNYKKFLSNLTELENKFKDKVEKNNFLCQIKYEIDNFINKTFYINRLCNIIIDNENEIFNYKDENIFENGMQEGIMLAINEINSYE